MNKWVYFGQVPIIPFDSIQEICQQHWSIQSAFVWRFSTVKRVPQLEAAMLPHFNFIKNLKSQIEIVGFLTKDFIK